MHDHPALPVVLETPAPAVPERLRRPDLAVLDD